MLGLVLCGVLLSLAYPLQQFVEQREQIATLQSDQEQAARRVAALGERREQWRNPAYVRAQARERLQFVLPGEEAYVVLDPPAVAPPGAGVDGPTPPQVDPGTDPDAAWWSRLWGSVEASDAPKR